ncbi:hypothetical protein Cgig2_003001 [Carnegiea gigantea]|uniref:CCHC-type domain-containing protein n=1 Tax=Carnegiea gigantea TaxID=171969 RepID=A0A9Q1JJE7_9CARY|nr:hypothetical protein Cgig2_003001 [Carnegiea gigantea]
MDDLEVEWGWMKLTQEEEDMVEFEEEVLNEKKKEIAPSLLGKLLTLNNVTVRAMNIVFRNIWWQTNLTKTFFIFQYFSKKDREFVLSGGPWVLDACILLMKQVNMDVKKPLCCGMYVKVDGKSIWIYFKFFKLPDCCYGCGKLGHVLKACEEVDSDTLEVDFNIARGSEVHPLNRDNIMRRRIFRRNDGYMRHLGRIRRVTILNKDGLGEAQAISDLCRLLRRYSPRVVFVLETKRSAVEIVAIRDQLGDFEGPVCRCLRELVMSQLGALRGFMGVLNCNLSYIQVMGGCGDLNEIFYDSEKNGGLLNSQALIDSFRNYFLDNDLYDFGYSGYDYTWCSSCSKDEAVEERLDRFCASADWSLQFPDASVLHMDSNLSNHLLILLKCSSWSGNGGNLSKFLHFKNMWVISLESENVIGRAWSLVVAGDTVDALSAKLDVCASELAS